MGKALLFHLKYVSIDFYVDINNNLMFVMLTLLLQNHNFELRLIKLN